MISELEKLIELQAIDNQIKKSRQEYAKQEKAITALQEKVRKTQTRLDIVQGNLAEQQKEHRRLERELEDKEKNIKKYKNQLLTVKTNREYQALQKEIDTHESEKGGIEEKILQVLEVIDDLQSEIKESKEQVKASENKVATETEEKQAQLAELQKEIDLKQTQRNKICQEIPAKLLTEYDKLLLRRVGLAVTKVLDCNCQGCYINIPPQDYEELKRGDKIYYCSNCSRILYWENKIVTEEEC